MEEELTVEMEEELTVEAVRGLSAEVKKIEEKAKEHVTVTKGQESLMDALQYFDGAEIGNAVHEAASRAEESKRNTEFYRRQSKALNSQVTCNVPPNLVSSQIARMNNLQRASHRP